MRTGHVPLRCGVAAIVAACFLPATPCQEYVAGDDPRFPKLRFSDGLISVNDRCPVRRRKLTPRITPLYVNGMPVGSC